MTGPFTSRVRALPCARGSARFHGPTVVDRLIANLRILMVIAKAQWRFIGHDWVAKVKAPEWISSRYGMKSNPR
jgi:hypothetical protein